MSQKIRHDQLRSVLIAPHVSEKTTMLSQESGQIVFRVRPDSNKQQIKKAVEKFFDVKVSSVRTVSVNGKTKRFGARTGKTKNWKKAYIKLAEGQNLDILNTDAYRNGSYKGKSNISRPKICSDC